MTFAIDYYGYVCYNQSIPLLTGDLWDDFTMKKILQRFLMALLASTGLLFGAQLHPELSLTPTAYAIEETPAEDEAVADEEVESDDNEEQEGEEKEEDGSESICQDQAGSISWFICPLVNTTGNLVDAVYGYIEQFLTIKPLINNPESPIFKVWSYVRDITNIIFVIFLLIVIYSQFTGLGINNYGVKRILPRLIIAVVMVNLSFILSALAIDISNIIGHNFSNFFSNITEVIQLEINPDISWSSLAKGLTVGAGALWGVSTAVGGMGALLWILLFALIGAALALIIGLITISLRQGVVLILVMIAPLAFVSYLLPNTEKWFEKWKNLLFQMLFFYPMFSFLFGASRLAGLTIISNAGEDGFQILLGLAVQVIPLVLAPSLLKMSNTVLGKISSGLDRAFDPARHTLGAWTASHGEKNRQHYLRNNRFVTGARLRNYLTYRQRLREHDIAETGDIVEGRALTRALDVSSSIRGRNSDGSSKFKRYANGYTRRAKEASMQRTITDNAKQNYANTLSEYGDVFHGRTARRLSDGHAEAYVDSMAQSFRAENIAQSDQSYLLKRYLNAIKNQDRAPYEYNRLVASAAGGLGHIGEATIMGQVLQRSADIEAKRRREALVVSTKFNLSKTEFRGMAFDKKHINDDGFEIDDQGNVIEDSQYRLLPGAKHQEWDKYIAVHKTTGKEISAEEYRALSDKHRADYRRVRYMDIRDDAGDVVQRVYEDDAGYMKELLLKDIQVGDPINRRYNISYGLAQNDTEKTGLLRTYHSTISAGMLSTGYKEHAAEVTPMITAQANSGYITSIGQYNIANLQSLTVASKAGPIFQNDAYVIKDWARLINSLTSTTPGETFEDLFPDQDVDNYRDVNGRKLGGMREVTDPLTGQKHWEEINRNDPALTLEDKKNLLKHKIIPRAAQKLAGSLNRNMTPNMLENQKPATLKALELLAQTLKQVGLDNINDDVEFGQRLNPDTNIFEAKDPNIIKQYIQEAQHIINDQLAKSEQDDNYQAQQSPLSTIQRNLQNHDQTVDRLVDSVRDLFAYGIDNPEAIYQQIQSIFSSTPQLQPFADEANRLIEQYRFLDNPSSTEQAIDQSVNSSAYMKANLNALEAEILNLMNQANNLH